MEGKKKRGRSTKRGYTDLARQLALGEFLGEERTRFEDGLVRCEYCLLFVFAQYQLHYGRCKVASLVLAGYPIALTSKRAMLWSGSVHT